MNKFKGNCFIGHDTSIYCTNTREYTNIQIRAKICKYPLKIKTIIIISSSSISIIVNNKLVYCTIKLTCSTLLPSLFF